MCTTAASFGPELFSGCTDLHTDMQDTPVFLIVSLCLCLSLCANVRRGRCDDCHSSPSRYTWVDIVRVVRIVRFCMKASSAR